MKRSRNVLLLGILAMIGIEITIGSDFTQTVTDGVVQKEVIESGSQEVMGSGTTQYVTIKREGVQRVRDGGKTSKSFVERGGVQKVEQGGRAIGTVVHAGGVQTVGSGGISIGGVIGGGGTQHVQNRGVVEVTESALNNPEIPQAASSGWLV